MTTGWPCGVGLGWRPELAGLFDGLPGLRFTEVIAESLALSGRPPAALTHRLQRGVIVIPHGIRLSLGGAEPLEPERAEFLARCAETLNAPLVSEHIAFVRAGDVEAGHLLPVPRTREMVDLLTRKIQLDIANLYANARNRGADPVAVLDRLPLDRVADVHVAGGCERDGFYHDTHTDPMPSEVLDLVTALCARRPALGFLLERDGGYPPGEDLYAELDAIADAAGHPRITTAGSVPQRHTPQHDTPLTP